MNKRHSSILFIKQNAVQSQDEIKIPKAEQSLVLKIILLEHEIEFIKKREQIHKYINIKIHNKIKNTHLNGNLF